MSEITKHIASQNFDMVNDIKFGPSNNLQAQIAFSLLCLQKKKAAGKPIDIEIKLNRRQHSSAEEVDDYIKQLVK